jgi:hypothetical protein
VSASPKEGVEDAGKIAGKYVLKAPESLGKVLAPAHALNSGVAELVIGGTLLVVREDLVGFGGFLKLFLRLFIPRVFIRVVLYGQLPVGFFYIVLGSVFRDPEDFVIISLGH